MGCVVDACGFEPLHAISSLLSNAFPQPESKTWLVLRPISSVEVSVGVRYLLRPLHIPLLKFLKTMTGYSRWIDPIACTNLCATLVANPACCLVGLRGRIATPGVSRGLCAAMGEY